MFPCCVRLLHRLTPEHIFDFITGPFSHTPPQTFAPSLRGQPITAEDFFLQPDKMTLALLNGITAPAAESELSLRDSGSGTLIQPRLQTWTHFNGTLCNLETAIECPAFQHPAQAEAQ